LVEFKGASGTHNSNAQEYLKMYQQVAKSTTHKVEQLLVVQEGFYNAAQNITARLRQSANEIKKQIQEDQKEIMADYKNGQSALAQSSKKTKPTTGKIGKIARKLKNTQRDNAAMRKAFVLIDDKIHEFAIFVDSLGLSQKRAQPLINKMHELLWNDQVKMKGSKKNRVPNLKKSSIKAICSTFNDSYEDSSDEEDDSDSDVKPKNVVLRITTPVAKPDFSTGDSSDEKSEEEDIDLSQEAMDVEAEQADLERAKELREKAKLIRKQKQKKKRYSLKNQGGSAKKKARTAKSSKKKKKKKKKASSSDSDSDSDSD